jgi:hypothetical protein
MPIPPAVTDNCGNTITPSAGVAGVDPTCAGTKTITFTYTNCDGTTVDWIYTYTIVAPTFTLPAPGASSVACIAMQCCQHHLRLRITVVIPSPHRLVSRSGSNCCWNKNLYVHLYQLRWTHVDWIYTYTIAAPTFTLPAPGASTVACIAMR